ncbi:MAG: hypothetical protein ACRDNK_23575 [Solirubrobacteraceae bacterium]
MTLYAATIGAKALYLLFVWLLSCAGAAWLADRKGYTERVGLTFGLVLTFVGFLIVLLLPARPGSAWKLDGPFPRRGGGRARPEDNAAPAPASATDTTPPSPGGAGEPPVTPGP